MAYKSTYHEDSDADDEYERSVIASPTLPPEFDSMSSPGGTDSDAPSENTPTTYTHSGDGNSPSMDLITHWSPKQVADFVEKTLKLEGYSKDIIEEAINGEALVALQHEDLKELGVSSVGHRLTILKTVYEIKIKQQIPLGPDDYVPPSAEGNQVDQAATQDDITRIIESIRLRDERIIAAETELRQMKEDLNKILDENRRLREDYLPLVRTLKDRSHPLPTPAGDNQDQLYSPPPPELQPSKKGGISRQVSTKLFLNSTPKNPSPTIHEGRALNDGGGLHPSAAVMAANNDLNGAPQTSPSQISQASPTSPAYSSQVPPSARSFARNEPPSARSNYHYDDATVTSSSWASMFDRDRSNPTPVANARRGTEDTGTLSSSMSINPGLASSGSSIGPGSASMALTPSNVSIAPSVATTSDRHDRERKESKENPQVEIFKSFRVSIEDPCHKVLPVALKKYNITADWRQYALYIVHGDQERCLGLQEKPLILFKQLDKEGRKPMFMLRRHASPQEGHENYIGGQPLQHTGTTLPGGVL